MMIITKPELEQRKEFYARKLKEAVFIYPTDTIYGIGCNALDGRLVNKIRDLKGRYEMPFSVIAPSKDWIRTHCVIDEEGEEWLAKLPGPYTLICKVKETEELPVGVTQGRDTLGVRIPDHWISSFVKSLNTPIITTSANKTGENHMTDVDDFPSDWRSDVEYIIDEGAIKGTPSTLIHLYKEEVEVQER